VLPDGTVEHRLKMRARPFKCGTRVITRTGGGGGYGTPLARPFDEVLEDVRYGFVSRDKAWELYGVCIDSGLVVSEAKSRQRHAP
jgi:N-methylhydantoinase B